MLASSVILAAQRQWGIWPHEALGWESPPVPPPFPETRGAILEPWCWSGGSSCFPGVACIFSQVTLARHGVLLRGPLALSVPCRHLSSWCTTWWQQRWSRCLRIRPMSCWSSLRTSVTSSVTPPCTAKSSFPAQLPATILQGRSNAGKLFHPASQA